MLLRPPNIFWNRVQPNLGSAWLSLAQLGSAWLNLAQLGSAFLCFCFTLFLSGIVRPNLASFSPKPFGHVRIIAVIRLFPFRHSFTIQILIDFLFTNLSDNQLYSSLFKYHWEKPISFDLKWKCTPDIGKTKLLSHLIIFPSNVQNPFPAIFKVWKLDRVIEYVCT